MPGAAARNDHMGHDCWGLSPRPRAERGGGAVSLRHAVREHHRPAGRLPCLALARGTGPGRAGARLADRAVRHGGSPGGGPARADRWGGRAHVSRLRPLSGGGDARLAAERPGAVILSNADYYMEGDGVGPSLPESVWAEGLRRTYARLTRMGIQVVVMRDVPWAPFDVPSCLSRRAAGLPLAGDRRFEPKRGFMARAQRAQDRAGRGLRVRFIDMNDQVCAPGARAARPSGTGWCCTPTTTTSPGPSRTPGPMLGERLEAAPPPAPLGLKSVAQGLQERHDCPPGPASAAGFQFLPVDRCGPFGGRPAVGGSCLDLRVRPRASRLDVARIVEVYDPLERLEVPVVAIGLH